MQAQILFHIGMHKTGSTFLQEEYFPRICGELGYIYNPKNILSVLDAAYRKGFRGVDEEIEIIRKFFKFNKGKIVISDEGLSGNPWNNLNYFQDAILFIEQCSRGFNCQILIVIRNQPDYLESLYRHAILRYESISIERFLNYRKGAFQKSTSSENVGEPRNIDVRHYDYSVIIQKIEDLSSIKPIVLFYEDLKHFPEKFYVSLNRVMGYSRNFNISNTKKQNVSIKSFDVLLIRFFGALFFWNSINYPWRRGNFFGFVTRHFLNANINFAMHLTSKFTKRNKSIMRPKMRSEILALHKKGNCKLKIPDRIKCYY